MKHLYSTIVILLIVLVIPGGVSGKTGRQKKQKDQPITLSGNIKDRTGLNLVGVEVTIQESFIHTESDEFGNFTVTVPRKGSVLVFREPYHLEYTMQVKSDSFAQIIMELAPEGMGIDNTVQMPWYETSARALTGAVYTVGSDDIRITPVSSLNNALAGKVPGMSIRQTGGLPGNDLSYIRIRGIRTLEEGGLNTMTKGSTYTPLIIVDGFERDFTQLDANEIASLTVLKDAAATALYGLRGAKGVVMVTTKRGQKNRRTIHLDMSTGIITPTKLPDFLDSYQYAVLYNEALANDGKAPLYTDDDLQKYQDHAAPLTHPDVDYYKEFIKKAAFQSNTNLSMSGGNNIVRYFVFMGFNQEQGLFKRTNENPNFNTKIRYNRYNLRSNLDVNITKWLTLYANIAGRIQDRRYYYTTGSTIWGVLSSYPPNAFPLVFKGIDPNLNKEITMLGGNSLYTQNPLGLLSYNGYNESTRRYYQATGRLHGALDMIAKGLSVDFSYHMDGYNAYRVEQHKNFLVWEYKAQPDGTATYTSYGTESSLTATGYYDVDRLSGLDAALRYERNFGKHEISAFIGYYHEKIEPRQNNYPDQKWQSYQGHFQYNFNERYYLDFAASYSGSDRFYYTKHPMLFCPAVSGAWIISSEPFIQRGASWINLLKLRASWGMSGNDQYTYTDTNGEAERYPARLRYWVHSKQQYFGTALTSVVFIREGRGTNTDIRPEKGRMWNIGLDVSLFRHSLDFSFDYWREHRYDIFTVSEGSLPYILGMTSSRLPITNDGIVDSQGWEFSWNFHRKTGDFRYGIGGYIDWFRNTVVSMSEPPREHENLVQTGHGVRQNWGLISLGLFKDWDDINNSPVQTFGNYRPGDIKYQDINSDNVIDANDYVCLGDSSIPRLNASLNLSFSWRNLDLTAVFQATARRHAYMNNAACWAFKDNGKISSYALGRYHSLDDGTTNWETATYPRLTTESNDNNWRASTYWLKDASYIRLKNLELGYNIPQKIVKKAGLYGLRLYLNAYNVFTLSKIKDFDPEDTNAAFNSYCMTRVFNFGVTLKF